MRKNKVILATGATGFVGANLVRRLVEHADYDVHILVRENSNKWRINDLLPRLTQHTTNLSDYEQLCQTIEKVKPNCIFHLAAYGGYPRIQTDVNKIIQTNFIGTVNLVNACDNIPYDCFVNTGSSSEYGLKDHPMAESDILEPVNAYGAAKAASTLFCQMTAKTTGKPISTLRLFSAYGYYEESFRLIPDVILHCLRDEDLSLTKGVQMRDFVFIEDVVDAYLKAMSNPKLGGEILNVGSGRQHSVREVSEKIRGLMESDIKLVWGGKTTPAFEPKCWVANTKKARKKLGWAPKHRMDDGLKKTIRWFRENRGLYK